MSDQMTMIKLEEMRDQLIEDLQDRIRKFNQESGTCVVEIDVNTVKLEDAKGNRNSQFQNILVQIEIPTPYVEPIG